MKIEVDIIEEIEKQVEVNTERSNLMELCEKVAELNLNVGNNQLLRCLLQLSNFDAMKFKEIVDSNFTGDPRDVLMEANNKFAGINFGITKF